MELVRTHTQERGCEQLFYSIGVDSRRLKGERDQRPLGEGLSQEREARQGGRAEMWPRWQQATKGGWVDNVMDLSTYWHTKQ